MPFVKTIHQCDPPLLAPDGILTLFECEHCKATWRIVQLSTLGPAAGITHITWERVYSWSTVHKKRAEGA